MAPVRVKAFTLIETVVVIVIVGILATISFFAFRQFLNAGHDTDATEKLQSAATEQSRFAQQWGSYTNFPSDLKHPVGDTNFVTTNSSNANQISLAVGSQGYAGFAIRSNSGKCLYLRLAPTRAGGDPISVTNIASSRPCNGQEALLAGETAKASVSVKNKF